MVETLLKQEIERKINKGENDTTKQHNGQTIINIDHSLSTYALLYLLLNQYSKAEADTDIQLDADGKINLSVEKKLKKMIEDVILVREQNKEFYLEVLDGLG